MKTLTLLLICVCSFASAQIATKSIGLDTLTGLNQRVNVWQITIDAKAEIVVVVYNIETLAPTGVVVAVSENKTYSRANKEGDMRFNALAGSQVGQLITGMVINDLNKYPDLQQ